MDPLSVFSERTRAWFQRAFEAPTPAQERGWPVIASGAHTLIQAPTGSGKTLAAFLFGLDRLDAEPGERHPAALRLAAEGAQLRRRAQPARPAGRPRERAPGRRPHRRHAAARARSRCSGTRPTSSSPRRSRSTSAHLAGARDCCAASQTLILDEVHAVAGTKRGAHLALTVERLERLVEEPFQRIGLSATQRPLEEIGRFVAGGRPIELVDAGRAQGARPPGRHARRGHARAAVHTAALVPGAGRRPGDGRGHRAQQRSRSGRRSTRSCCELVREHRSTIVFVNNRRLAERLALRLNELAEEEIARAHHGSIAREQRVEIEELLKRGEIPCLVATSSLELGIDMGAVDLVIQVESAEVGRARAAARRPRRPRARRRLARAHLPEVPRRPARVRGRRAGACWTARSRRPSIPRNPLDVLAQQIVAICADDEIAVDDLHDLVAARLPVPDLSRAQLENVLDMLAGRYPSDEFAELRPRIVWDRTGGTIRGRSGARRLAVTNAGTIPDRGLFGVFLVDGGGRVGELDEEMVYEARAGQTFLLGASTWRIEEITRDRVLVSPAPGVPGAVPFWKGEGVGRPYELGAAIGKTSRELVALPDEKALARLRNDHWLDERAAPQPAHVPARAGRGDRRGARPTAPS